MLKSATRYSIVLSKRARAQKAVRECRTVLDSIQPEVASAKGLLKVPEGTKRYSTILYLKISVQKVSKCIDGYRTVSNGTLPEGAGAEVFGEYHTVHYGTQLYSTGGC